MQDGRLREGINAVFMGRWKSDDLDLVEAPAVKLVEEEDQVGVGELYLYLSQSFGLAWRVGQSVLSIS